VEVSQAGTLDVAVPMKDAEPGPLTLEIYQFGWKSPTRVAAAAYAEAASLDRLTLSAGDQVATLRGNAAGRGGQGGA
jgi:hypothetical protein